MREILFRSRFGPVVVAEVRAQRVFWRWADSRLEFGPYRTRFAALMDAAHSCRVSGATADFCQVSP